MSYVEILVKPSYIQVCLLYETPDLTGAAEYSNCISAEGYDSPNKCPGYDAKQSDG